MHMYVCVVLACVRVHIVCWLRGFAEVRVCTLHWSRVSGWIVAVISECISNVLRFFEVTRNSDQSEAFFVNLSFKIDLAPNVIYEFPGKAIAWRLLGMSVTRRTFHPAFVMCNRDNNSYTTT